jgi:hypothetical protein
MPESAHVVVVDQSCQAPVSGGTIVTAQQQFPPLPEIGRPDVFYTHAIEVAEREGDIHCRASLKVGRYITIALDPRLPWAEKCRYFVHALRHHCTPPSNDPDVQRYYEQLANLIRQYAGTEALRLASAEDDMYAARTALGQARSEIENEAETFFGALLGSTDRCPQHFDPVDWDQLKLLRDQWI